MTNFVTFLQCGIETDGSDCELTPRCIADAQHQNVPSEFSEAYNYLVSTVRLSPTYIKCAKGSLCVDIENHWFGVIRSDGKVNTDAALKAKNYARFVELSTKNAEELEGQYMVVNSDGSVYIAQTSSEVLSRQTDHTSYSGMVGDIVSRFESGVYLFPKNHKPKDFDNYASRILTKDPVPVKGLYPSNRRWISVSLKVSGEVEQYRTEHFLLDTGSPISIIQESCLTFEIYDEKEKKLSCSGHVYSDRSRERGTCNYLFEVQLFVENHQVRFRVFPPTLAEYLVEIDAKIAEAEKMKEETESSA